MELPLDQQAIRAKCIHPSGRFVEFPQEDVELSMPARFEKIAARYGHRTAVKRGNHALTYQDLNQAANRLAHAIVAQRGRVQEPIALLMEHDIPLFVAIIGVLKAGKICLVLDPSFPKDHSAFLLQDSQASLLIAAGAVSSICRHPHREELFPHLRIIQLGSDLVTPKEIEEYQRHFSANTILVIRFGTTETGTLRRMYFDSESSLTEIQNAVGYATEGADICLIDDNGAALPCDAVGEIVVKSRYLSPGYWRRPDLSREKFIPNPNDGDQRIYHTGDLGRLRSDGCLDHLGRKDFQLSVRGYRVEAGEIEAVLLAQENVKEALVATVGNSNGAVHDRLVAYIVAFEKPFPATSILRRAAGQKLPAHMVPSDFVFLESLPLTPNGKVDRLAFPAPDRSRPELEVAYAAPRSDIETLLAKIWAEVLDIDLVGIHDNFFDLGGHSLAASRVISRVIQSFKLVLPVRALYDAPTVARMAEVVKQNHVHRADDAELEQMLRQVETMTEEEAQRDVAKMSSRDAIK